MSSTLEVDREISPPQASLLQDHVPQALRFPRVAAGFALAIGVVHWCYSMQRLFHTDLWGHLAYGKLIATTHALPASEHLMPLAEGMPLIDSAWLTQLVAFWVNSLWGAPGLQFLHALAITCCLSLLAIGCYRQTKSFGFSIVALVVLELVNWFQFQIIRPQMAGLVCFTLLATFHSSRLWRNAYWVAIPALMALWANLHGSFLVGLGLLGCATIGRAVDVWRKTGKLAAIRRDSRMRRLFLLTELASVAVLINPYGLGLYAEVIGFSSNPNLQSLLEWDPLNVRSTQGMIAVGVGLTLAVVYRLSPRRVPAGEALALIGLGAATLWSARFLIWWAPLAAAAFAVHAHAAWSKFHPRQSLAPVVRTGKWTAITCGIAWIFFAWTPFGMTFLHGKTPELSKSVSRQTPLGAVDWLKQHPPSGLIFNPYEWGDFLVWAGPENLKVFVTSHAHLVPHEVWRDYLNVVNTGSNWEEVFDRYGVETIVADVSEHATLISKLKENSLWKRNYEDRLAVIFTRQTTAERIENKNHE